MSLPFSTDGLEEKKPQLVTMGRKDDYVRGALIDVYTPSEPDQWGKIKNKYTIKVTEGKFHHAYKDDADVYTVDTEPTIPQKGEIWQFWGKEAIDKQANQVPLNHEIVFHLAELRKGKKGTAKIYKVFGGADMSDFVNEGKVQEVDYPTNDGPPTADDVPNWGDAE